MMVEGYPYPLETIEYYKKERDRLEDLLIFQIGLTNNNKKQLDIVDFELGWNGTGIGRVEAVRRLKERYTFKEMGRLYDTRS